MVGVPVVGYFMPVFAFLLVFIVIYALLKKTGIFGEGESVAFTISFILSSLFVVGVILFNFARFSSAWFSWSVIGLFVLLVILTFLPWKQRWGFFAKDNLFSWIFLGLIIMFFIGSSAYVFSWAVSWGLIYEWISSDWFGMVLVLGVLSIIYWKLKK